MSNLNPSVPVLGSGACSARIVATDHGRDVSVAAGAGACDASGAVAAAMQVFEAGLARLITAGTADPRPGAAEDVTGLLAAIAGQTSLMALRASIEAARDGAAGRGYTAAAADVRSLAGQMSRATETLVSQVGLIQAAAERAQEAAAERRAGSLTA